jgi:hypothetical protein
VAKGDPIDESRHVYPRDDMMDEKLKSWRVPFFSLLVHYYETRYCPNGIQHVPKIVMQACEDYKGDHDSFGKFIKARVDTKYSSNWDDPPTIKQFMKTYRGWVNEQPMGGKKITENELKIRLNERFGNPGVDGKYTKLRIFDSDEEKEEHIKSIEMESSLSNS